MKIHPILSMICKANPARKMPAPLAVRVIEQLLIGAVCCLLSIVCAIVFCDPSALLGICTGAFFFALALYTHYRFKRGMIIAKAVFCTNIPRQSFALKHVKSTITLVFRDAEENIFRFCITQKNCEFTQGNQYIVYFDADNPHMLIAYEAI